MKNSIDVKNSRLLLLTWKLFLDIPDVLNKRYSTGYINNLDSLILDIFIRYETILSTDSPFNVKNNIPHVDNVIKFIMENKSDVSKAIYIWKW